MNMVSNIYDFSDSSKLKRGKPSPGCKPAYPYPFSSYRWGIRAVFPLPFPQLKPSRASPRNGFLFIALYISFNYNRGINTIFYIFIIEN
jgi:hypothetical protein